MEGARYRAVIWTMVESIIHYIEQAQQNCNKSYQNGLIWGGEFPQPM